jgi:hypothetical protein
VFLLPEQPPHITLWESLSQRASILGSCRKFNPVQQYNHTKSPPEKSRVPDKKPPVVQPAHNNYPESKAFTIGSSTVTSVIKLILPR